MNAKTILIAYLVVVAIGTFLVFAPVVPQNIVLGPRCANGAPCPLFVILQHASVSPTYYAFGFGGVLTYPSWTYSFHWSQWRYV